MKKWYKVLAIATALVFSVVGFTACGGGGGEESSGGGGGEVIKLTVGAGHPETSMPYVKAGDEFFCNEVEKRVAEQTDYTIEWTKAYNGSVAKLAEVLGAVESGLLDVGFTCSAFEAKNLQLQNICYSIPFNVPSAADSLAALRVVYDQYTDEFNKAFEDKNQVLLGCGGVGNYQLITNFPVDELSDLKGHGIAAAGPNIPMLEGTGANPIQGDLTEAYSSFETGVYDGWVMYTGSSYGFKLQEVAPYQTNMNFGAVPCGWISVNKDKWDTLPEEVQNIMKEVGDEYWVEAGKVADEMDETGLQGMLDDGLTIVELKAGEQEKYAESLDNLPLRWAKEAEEYGYPGYDIMKAYIKACEDQGYVFPRDWLVDFPQ